MGYGGGVVVVSAGHVGGTRGSGIVSSAADVLGISVVRGMRGVGGVCITTLQLLYILPFDMLCLYAIIIMFVKHMFAVCMLVGMVV